MENGFIFTAPMITTPSYKLWMRFMEAFLNTCDVIVLWGIWRVARFVSLHVGIKNLSLLLLSELVIHLTLNPQASAKTVYLPDCECLNPTTIIIGDLWNTELDTLQFFRFGAADSYDYFERGTSSKTSSFAGVAGGSFTLIGLVGGWESDFKVVTFCRAKLQS